MRAAGVWILALLGSACGPGGSEPSGRVIALDIQRVGAVSQAVETVRDIDASEGTLLAGEGRFLTAADSPGDYAGGWTLKDDSIVQVDFPLGLEPSEFNVVRWDLAASTRTQLAAFLLCEGEVVARTSRIVHEGGGRIARARFDFPSVPDTVGQIDHIRIVAASKSVAGEPWGPVWVGSGALEKHPRLWQLPSPEVSSVQRVGRAGREGVAFSGEVSARVQAPRGLRGAEDAALEISLGVPPELPSPDGRTQVECRLDGEVERVVDVPSGVWKEFRLPGPRGSGWEFRVLGDRAGERLAVAGSARLVLGKPQGRDVLLVTSDTHRADHVACVTGGGKISTPVLDALAAKGTRFTRAWSAANVTNPSHVSLMTGQPVVRTGVIDNRLGLTEEARTLAEAFAAAGYKTAAVVSVPHLADESSGLGQGFDVYHAPQDRDLRLVDTLPAAMGLLDQERERPLFLWVHLFDAHAPYDAPGWDCRSTGGRPLPPDAVPTWETECTTVEGLELAYQAEVEILDGALGGLLEHPSLEEALVAFTSDHGESLGGHGIWWDHQGIYPDTLHVPLILKGPGVPAGQVVTDGVETRGLGRTLLRLGLGQLVEWPGDDLLEGQPAQDRFALSSGGTQASVTRDNWHLILELSGGSESRGGRARAKHSLRLYDLDQDPSCAFDVAPLHADVVRRLRAAVLVWVTQPPMDGWARRPELSPEDEARLVQLGYGGGSSDADSVASDLRGCTCEECAPWTGRQG